VEQLQFILNKKIQLKSILHIQLKRIFIADEVVEFVETGYTATIATVNAGDKNIINNYSFR